MIIKLLTIFDKELILKNDEVFDKETNQEIPVHLLKNGQRFILVNGKKVNYGLLKLSAFGKCYLPQGYWKGCRVGFHDSDVTNYSVDNLYVIFPKGGIESNDIKGFYFIPGYELNLINHEGKVYRRLKGTLTTPNPSEKLIDENKWYYSVLIDKTPLRAVTRRHNRLIALALGNPPDNYPELVTDHLNGIKTDNRLENLEWVTYQENSDRAVDSGFHHSATPVVVKDKVTGQITEHRSLKQMVELLGFDYDSLTRARKSPNKTYRFRYIIKDKDDETPWEVYEAIKTAVRSGPVKARDVYTGKVSHYESYVDVQRKTGIDRHTINRYFKFFEEPYILKGYEWKLEEDNSPWFEFNEYDLEKYRRGLHVRTKVVEIHDLLTDERHICYGWDEAVEITGIVRRNVQRAVKDNIVVKGRFKIKIVSS